MAWNQGVDLYGLDNNRVLAAAEYVAALLAEAGLEPAVLESHPRRTSVVARIPGRDPERLLTGPPPVLSADSEAAGLATGSPETASSARGGGS